MSMEAMIAEAAVQKIQPLFEEMYKQINSLQCTIADMRKMIDKPLSIQESADLMNCSTKTFKRYRKLYSHLIKPTGGTIKSPTFLREDIIGLREKIKKDNS